MLGQGAMLFQSRHMHSCRVAFMAIEAVLGVARMKVMHFPIPGHFGKDRCSRDGGHPTIPFYHRLCRARQVRHPVAIDQHGLSCHR